MDMTGSCAVARGRLGLVAGAALVAGLLLAMAGSAEALTTKECRAKFADAKTAGTLNGMNYKAFHAAQCADASSAAATPTTDSPGKGGTPAPATAATPVAPATPGPGKGGTAAAPTGDLVFPTAVSSKYSSETTGKARMHTCRDQYQANKTTGGNGGHKWIEKGDGYYSECSKHLKG